MLKVLLGVTVVLVVAGSQNGTSSPAPTRAPGAGDGLSPTPSAMVTSTTNIPGGSLTSCPGRPITTETAAVGERGTLTLQVYFAAEHGGRSCAVVTRTGTARTLPGELVTTLQLRTYDGRRWPRYAVQTSRDTARAEGLYLDETDGRCVRARARFRPDRGPAVRVGSSKVCAPR